MWSWLTSSKKAAAESHTNGAMTTAQTASNNTDAAPYAPSAPATAGVASSPPVDGSFWGYTTPDVSADSDIALDDMMQFFGFAHREHTSDYTGCVSFELTYPDGRKSIRTVEVQPKPPNNVTLEEEKSQEPSHPLKAMPRIVQYDTADRQLCSAVAARAPRYASWLRPVCTLYQPLIHTVQTASSTAATSRSDDLPRLPFSSRIRIHTGPVPADVKVTARLLCPRSVFFDVYLGRLDPMRAVLSGQAHCPGWRYYELLYFGQSFDMESQKWLDFYKAQEEIAEAVRKRGGGGGGGGSGGSAQLTTTAAGSPATAAAPSPVTASRMMLGPFSLARFLPPRMSLNFSVAPTTAASPLLTQTQSQPQPPWAAWRERASALLDTLHAHAANTMLQ